MYKHEPQTPANHHTESVSKGNRSVVYVSISFITPVEMLSIKPPLWAAVGANFSTSPGVWFNKSCRWWWMHLRSDSSSDYLLWSTDWWSADFFSNQPLLLQLGLHCFSEQDWKEPCSNEYLKRNNDTDLCLFLLTLHRTESLWHPVLSPHNLIKNWQYKLIARSLFQGTKQEAHKSLWSASVVTHYNKGTAN